jgi:hypothetical protein
MTTYRFRWLNEKAVDQQAWDPRVEALTPLPSILTNMDKHLSWASAATVVQARPSVPTS